LRWQHPQRGLIFPSEFITIAEDTGLIVPIGWWVLREACRQMKIWRQTIPEAEKLWVTVNLSPRQLAHPDIIQIILETLAEFELPADALKIEITEIALVKSDQEISEKLSRLRTAGIQICIDDFGIGYSSLSYLEQVPVDILKIDRPFVQAIDRNGQDAILRNMLTLAQLLGLEAVAEGTETSTQFQGLRELHCAYGQGWLFSKPLKPEDVTKLLT